MGYVQPLGRRIRPVARWGSSEDLERAHCLFEDSRAKQRKQVAQEVKIINILH